MERSLTSFRKIAVYCLRFACASLFLVLIPASPSYAAAVVFIRSPGGSPREQEQLQIAADFYGLDLKVITPNDDAELSRAVEQEDTVGIAIAANALGATDRSRVLRALNHRRGGSAPVLILGVAADTDPVLLRTWSGGTASGCKSLQNSVHSHYAFGSVGGISGQLANVEVEPPFKKPFYLVPGDNPAAQSIVSLRHDNVLSPVFINTSVGEQKIFVSCRLSSDDSLTGADDPANAFLRVAPGMMFVKYCAGERGWHATHHYANLTIDDPWLRQTYGYVDYSGLLEEMEKHGFHTTIAFIPWNYDRSESGTVSLFRNHPDRFSIAIHGDNHDHKEFTDYRSKPLNVQIADLKQSLARMEQFRALTGIPYDRVMVFPHSIAPEQTLEALKRYNYLATVNSTNVPQDAVTPSALSFFLRPVTLSFGGFPSVIRYSVEAQIPEGFLAINEFLDNPLLFYGHSESFAKGIGAFDQLADEVNKLDPETQWRSLGDIARHLYLVRQREDSNFDVLAFSSNICLDNTSRQDSSFYVRKQEIGPQTVDAVTVDGQRHEYQIQDGYLSFSMLVPANSIRCSDIQYKNDLVVASTSLSKDSFVVYLLRMASDFRDIYLSKVSGGLAIIRFYNEHEVTPAEVFECVLVFMGICILAWYRWRTFAKRRHDH
jgi:hypothetical protein